jgi:hypothetical protein
MPWEKTTVPDRLSQQVTVLTHRRQPRAHHALQGAPFSQGAISGELARLASSSALPLYAIDDETAIKVVDGEVEVISEGAWRLFDK